MIVDDLAAIHEDFHKILANRPAKAGLHEASAALFGSVSASPAPFAYSLDDAYQGQEALRLVQHAVAAGSPYALAFVDVRMPTGWDGLETVRHIWAVDPAIQVVLCTAYSDHSWGETTRALGHTDNLIILKKPFDNIEVIQLAHALTRKWQLSRENAARVAALDERVRQRTEELRLAQETLTQAFSANPLAQAVIDLETGRVTTVNSAFEHIIGVKAAEVVGTTPESFGRGVEAERWLELLTKLRAGLPVDDHAFVYRPTPEVRREMRCSARAIVIANRPASVWVLQDVTDRVRLEADLRQSQKMQAIGQLTAGIAHDFNNLLTGIQGYANELLADPTNDRLRPLLNPINDCVVRGATLTHHLLVFGRKQIIQLERLNLSIALGNMNKLLVRLLGETIEFHWDLPVTLPPIVADASAIEQIVMSLVLNARDALTHRGIIRVAAAPREFGSAAETGHPEGRAGKFIELKVSDNGPGIAPDLLPRIFEPFVTRKEIGLGAGLGLSTANSLVQQHRGWIEVSTAAGQGSAFKVFLPAAETSAKLPAAASPGSPAAPAVLPPLRVLAVDDDSLVRQFLSMLFMRNKVNHTIVEDGVKAIAEWKNSGPYDLVVTDIMMPNGVSGIDLARHLRSVDPRIPIVFITGYSPEHVGAQDIKLPGRAPRVVLKPFEAKVLFEAMRNAVSDPVD